MNQYRRIVSYLYKYANNKKGENTGYVRVDTKEAGIRLHFHIKDLRMMDERQLKAYFYIHKENHLKPIFVDEFLCTRGNCEYKNLVSPDMGEEVFDDINGIVILDQHGLLYGSCWDDREISAEMLMENIHVDSKNVEEIEKEEQLLVQNAESELHVSESKVGTGMERMLSGFTKIELEGPENLIQAARIELKDIAKLSPEDWKLADNAFLKQSYEMEEHLIIGKIRMQNDKEVWILGVPGTYDNREKYLAGIFGFLDYIPREKEEFKTGGKGYWIRQIKEVE